MAKRFLYSSFNQKVEFGKIESVENDNTGDNTETFVPSFKMWARPAKRSRNQTYTLIGMKQQDTIDLIVRHDERLSDQLKVVYKKKIYDILDYSPNDGQGYFGYDYLTIKLSKKVG